MTAPYPDCLCNVGAAIGPILSRPLEPDYVLFPSKRFITFMSLYLVEDARRSTDRTERRSGAPQTAPAAQLQILAPSARKTINQVSILSAPIPTSLLSNLQIVLLLLIVILVHIIALGFIQDCPD